MSLAVIDASALVHFVSKGQYFPVIGDLLESKSVVMAPSLIHAEVANALWKYVRAGKLTRDAAVVRLTGALRLVDDVTEDGEIAAEALVVADAHGHPVYDMLYAVLARRHGCPVVTLDRRFIKILEQMGVSAESPLN